MALTQPERRRWRFGWLSVIIAVFLLAGMTLLLYPTAAGWVSQRNQSNILFDQTRATSEKAQAELDKALADAAEFNRKLRSGAILSSGANVAEGIGDEDSPLDYWDLLTGTPTGTMARLRVPAIELDLPVYHGTSDSTLLKGVGHLQGTSLPVGGEGTRSVLTGHRGLANATMFTHLNKVKEGDTFSVEVMGEVFAYRVFEIQVVEPEATEEIRAVPGKDLMTLITCTPLGVNSHRILVTGERIEPTPKGDLDAMSARPDVPGFPWWLLLYAAGVVGIGLWYWRSGYVAEVTPKVDPEATPEESASPPSPSATPTAPAASTSSSS